MTVTYPLDHLGRLRGGRGEPATHDMRGETLDMLELFEGAGLDMLWAERFDPFWRTPIYAIIARDDLGQCWAVRGDDEQAIVDQLADQLECDFLPRSPDPDRH